MAIKASLTFKGKASKGWMSLPQATRPKAWS